MADTTTTTTTDKSNPTTSTSTYKVRHAERKDCESIALLIKELAVYEKMEVQAKLTSKDLERDAFDSNPPYFRCIVAEVCPNPPDSGAGAENNNDGIVIGFALYFWTYSTWEGKMIYMEDFYVTPKYRSVGIGSKLLKFLAKICVDGGFVRLKLECLDWNAPAIQFYKKHHAIDLTEAEGWHSFRFTKETLASMVKED